MSSKSSPSGVILSSPWFLLLFLVIPAAVVLNLTLHLGLPLLDPRLMLVNNIAFAILALCRLLAYLKRVGRDVRYGEEGAPAEGGYDCPLSASRAREALSGGGYVFAAGGRYGERRDPGFLGLVLLYAGLALLLCTGSMDNLRQFAGSFLDAMGPATNLAKPEVYRAVSMGPLSGKGKDLPQLRVLSQILPDSSYPKGATEIALTSEDGAPETAVLVPGVPYNYRGYDISMKKLVFQPEIVIKTKEGQLLYDELVQLDPLVAKRGDFSFYGPFAGPQVVGGVYYQPEKNLMMMVVTRNGKKVVSDLTFQTDQQVTAEGYVLSCAKLGQWSELHVIRRRHKGLLFAGGVIALLGLALRLAFPPQRVWLQETDAGCRVVAAGRAWKKLLEVQ